VGVKLEREGSAPPRLCRTIRWRNTGEGDVDFRAGQGTWACCACWMTRRLAGAVLAELEVATSATSSSDYSSQWRMKTFGRYVAIPSFLAASRLPLRGRKIVLELGKSTTLNMLAISSPTGTF